MTELRGDMEGVGIGLRPNPDNIEVTKPDQVPKKLLVVGLRCYVQGGLARVVLERHQRGERVSIGGIVGDEAVDDELEVVEVAGSDGGEEGVVRKEAERLRRLHSWFWLGFQC